MEKEARLSPEELEVLRKEIAQHLRDDEAILREIRQHVENTELLFNLKAENKTHPILMLLAKIKILLGKLL